MTKITKVKTMFHRKTGKFRKLSETANYTNPPSNSLQANISNTQISMICEEINNFSTEDFRTKSSTKICETPFRKVRHLPRRLNLTDYFEKRRSNRSNQTYIDAKKQEDLETKILNGLQSGLEVRFFEGKGRGILATRKFVLNEFVVEYAGELLTGNLARTRENSYSKDDKKGCYLYYFRHRGTQYCVDATDETERFGRLINHCKEGNLSTKIVDVRGIPRLVFFAKRDINKGEELSYDYGDRRREVLKHNQWLSR